MLIKEYEKTIDIYPFVDEGKKPVWADGAITVSKDSDNQLTVTINCQLDRLVTKVEWEQFKAAVDKAFDLRQTLQNGGKINVT